MVSPANLTRDQLSQIAGGNPRVIKALEMVLQAANQSIPADISALQADVAALQLLTQIFTATTDGIVPASGGSANNFLKGDATWGHNLDILSFNAGYIPTTPAVGEVWFDSNAAVNARITSNITANLGRNTYIYCKASSAITFGQLCVFTGAIGASGVVTAAPAGAGVTAPEYIIGIAAENIALNGFGLIQILGDIRGFDTTGTPYGETWIDGDILYYNPASGGLTKVYPASGIIVTVAAITNAGSGGSGSMTIRPTISQRVTAGAGITVTQTASGVTIGASGSGVTMTEVELDFGTSAVREKSFTVTDASVVPTSKLSFVHSLATPTGGTGDESEMDSFICRCKAGTGSFTVYVNSLFGAVSGKYKFNYLIG